MSSFRKLIFMLLTGILIVVLTLLGLTGYRLKVESNVSEYHTTLGTEPTSIFYR
ncbi:hypothetical protein [Echinicola shivajiensis]|uniref:hypothetical protein n=1 Tax=Echinicola shivajiensis TaxID=1035916 RepID=UPI001BFC40AB|nr:hypothetical protein [Echinicola shivajiensis]